MPPEDSYGKQGRDTELVLPPGTYAFVLDETKGNINAYCGPIKQSLSNTDRLVTYDANSKRFVPAGRAEQAIQTNIVCPKGCYVVLDNPAAGGRGQPQPGKADVMPIGTLDYGRTENLSGPQSFPLWPGQVATVVKGHHLRSNQYLIVRVYDDEAAKANWAKSVVKRVAVKDAKDAKDAKEASTDQVDSFLVALLDSLEIDTETLVTGQQIIITGTNVAFYIPPTGVEVLKDESEGGKYVRDAVTLERLEYSILLGENGKKEYRRGPDVVFPTPTQQFFKKGTERRFRAYELQPTNGIHIKVIAAYDEGDTHYSAGDEMFITGSDMPIYYPREEHAIISYGDTEKSYAVAIPAGEGRYVLDRRSGSVDLVVGPLMFLPNPIEEVIVRRILTDFECELYYPGNNEVLRFNRQLADKGIDVSTDPATMNAAIARTVRSARHEYGSDTIAESVRFDALSRSTTYTPPRMITLNTKFDGAVQINVFSGFAVQVVNSKGERRTVVGPKTVLLGYDEKLERLSLSKGKPKTSDLRLNTPYLRYISNPVSDIISLKTKDLVNVDVHVKYLVRFDAADLDRWFSIDNYVQYMVDHLRSIIGNAVRNYEVQEFYTNSTNILRDVVLGKNETEGTPTTLPQPRKRPLKHFHENGMTVYDLELISVTVQDRAVADLLARSRQETLSETIALDRATAVTAYVTGTQEALRKQMEEKSLTTALQLDLDASRAAKQAELDMAQALQENERQETIDLGEQASAQARKNVEALLLEISKAQRDLDKLYKDADSARDINREAELAKAQETRMKAVGPALVEAMVSLAQSGQFQAMAQHLAPLALIRNESLTGTLEQIFEGTPLAKMIGNFQKLSNIGKTIENG